MSNLSQPPPSTTPTTLADALEQLVALRTQLAATTRAIHQVTGLTLTEFLEKGGEGPAAPAVLESGDGATMVASANGGAVDDDAAAPPEGIDISSLILKALAVRKGVASGAMGEMEAEEDVKRMLPDGVTDDQVATVRQWAGL